MNMQKTDDASASMGKATEPDATTVFTGGVHLDDKRRELGEAYQRLASTGRDYVRSNPATTVLLAMAAGYSLSWLLRRRH